MDKKENENNDEITHQCVELQKILYNIDNNNNEGNENNNSEDEK